MNKKAGFAWVATCMIVWAVVGLILEKGFGFDINAPKTLLAISTIGSLTVSIISVVRIIRLPNPKKVSMGESDPNRILSNANLFAGPMAGVSATMLASAFNYCGVAGLGANLTIGLAIGGSIGLIWGIVIFLILMNFLKGLKDSISKANPKKG